MWLFRDISSFALRNRDFILRQAVELVGEEWGGSGVGELALGFGNGASEGLGRFDPLGDDGLGVGDGFFVGGSVGHAAGEFRDFDEEGLIVLAPVDDEFVAHVSRFPGGILESCIALVRLDMLWLCFQQVAS